MKILNTSKHTVIAQTYTLADSFFSRMVGLLNRSSLAEEDALVITQCQSIHMFFMRFAIDVIFVDRKNTVVGLVCNIGPWCLSPIYFQSSYAIEGAVGTIKKSQTAIGDHLLLEKS